MVGKAFFCFVFFCFISFSVFCRNNDSIQLNSETVIADSVSVNLQDTLTKVSDAAVINNDTVAWVTGEKIDIPLPPESKTRFSPNPTRAVLYTAIFPGLGQIYNRKYWKLPIVYGGLVGLVYAITWNGRVYGDYTDGYRAIMKEDYYSELNRDAWISLLSRSQAESARNNDYVLDSSTLATYRERIRKNRDFFRRNRDLSIIGVVGLYALSMIDAYVDAELFDFNVSPDLSFRVSPYVGLDAFQQKTIGIQCNIIF